MKPILSDLKNSILSLLNQNISVRKIVERLNVSIGTISKYRNKYCPILENQVGGGINKISEARKHRIKYDIITGRLKTAVQVHHELVKESIEVSYTTVIRVLKSMGFVARIKKKKPLLSKKHMAARYKWAKKHQYWTIDDWKRVIFSDETKINIWGSDGIKYY